MEKKQLFDNSLVGFHPETFLPLFELDINIDDNDIYGDFNITKDITIDDNFIDIYNKIKKVELCTILLNITNNNSDNSNAGFSGYRGTSSLFFRDTVILKSTKKILISNFDITNINISSKTASVNFIRKIISQSNSDNTVVQLTTRVNGLTDLTPGDFNETVTLTAKEYNALKEIPSGEIFILNDSVGSTTFLAFKIGANSIRANRDYIDANLSNRCLISFAVELEENNQATFKGNINKLMDSDNYLAKDNTTVYTPTSNYHPATKKYVDDSNYYYNKSNVELSTKSVTLGNKTYNFNYYYKLNVIKVSNGFVATINITRNDDTVRNITSAQFGNITLTNVNLSACIEFIDTIKDTDTKEYVKIRYYINADLIVNANNRTIDYDINSTSVRIEEAMVTESEYSAIGHTSTDNILYFVTPD